MCLQETKFLSIGGTNSKHRKTLLGSVNAVGCVANVQQEPAEVQERVAGQSSLRRDILYEVVASVEADHFGSISVTTRQSCVRTLPPAALAFLTVSLLGLTLVTPF